MKRSECSYIEQTHILTQPDLNGYGRLFGGKLMEWIDMAAAISARRFANRNVTTASVSKLDFLGPAYANEMIVLCATVVYTGNTSMDVCVRTYVEHLDGTRRQINTAYVVLVALDENEKPVKVPKLQIETPEEQAEWDKAVKRRTA